jgi:hypothetical protein
MLWLAAFFVALLGLFIPSTLFGLLDVYCWDVRSFCLSPQIHKKKYSGQGFCPARTFGRHSSYHFVELLTTKRNNSEIEHTSLLTVGHSASTLIRYYQPIP